MKIKNMATNKQSKLRYFLMVLVMLGFLSFNFSFAQEPNLKTPENFEEAKEIGENALETTKEELPGALEKIWQEDVLPAWKAMYDWFLNNIWSKIWPWAEEKIEEKKPIIKEEFEKEKEELKDEAPEVTKSLWERFKEIIK